MITVDNLPTLLSNLNFTKTKNIYSKSFANEVNLKVDMDKKVLIYPEKLTIHDKTTSNFSSHENFVVFECVHRLLEKGYQPKSIELEPKWKVGHGASGGKADILLKDNLGKSLLIIECKTSGKEFRNAWQHTLEDGAQLFGYAANENPQYLCLYASDCVDETLKSAYFLISLNDNVDFLAANKDKSLATFKEAKTRKDLFLVWKKTYGQEFVTKGLFEKTVEAYHIGKLKVYLDDLHTLDSTDIQPKYHEFATILRQHNISGRENAFDKLVNLFLCKIVDESEASKKPNVLQELDFYWKGIEADTYFDLQDRLQQLYKIGMKRFLNEDVTYIENEKVDIAFRYYKNDPNATRDTIMRFFKELKYFTHSDFAFIDVHNETLFYQNAEVLLKMVRMLQDIRLLHPEQQGQFLGDLFEGFLDRGIKQSEGQFFTPMPICRFMLQALPLNAIFIQSKEPPKVIDYACGAGHFLNELAMQIKPFINQGEAHQMGDYYREFYGIEKEYRLSKVAKVSTFMYGQDEINILYHDALVHHEKIKEASFSILVANPPYSVKGFLNTLDKTEREKYDLLETVNDKSLENNNSIETFFIERAKQLLMSQGVAGIIVPSSILSNGDATYTRTRELLLAYFDIVALVEFGSGTFGKTGTNTVVLFLRRKLSNPEPCVHYRQRVESWFNQNSAENQVIYEDSSTLKAYCQQIKIDFNDYQSLLAGKLSSVLQATEMFSSYWADFETKVIKRLIAPKYVKLAVNLKKTLTAKVKKQSEKDKTKLTVKEIKTQVEALFLVKNAELLVEKEAETDKRFLSYVQTVEQDKLVYFALAYDVSQKVLVVKSPSDGKAIKRFLGYDWGNAKGSEGIKLATDSEGNHLTPLYDPLNRDNAEKLSYWVGQNFLGNEINLSGL